MTQSKLFVGDIACSVAVAALLVACGAEPAATDQGRGLPNTTLGRAGGAAPVVPVGPTATPAAPTAAAPVGVPAARPAATPAAPLPVAPPAAAPAAPPVAGPAAPPAAAPAAPPAAAPAAPAGEWSPTANLDANGVLTAPAPGAGFQLATPEFSLQPGQELYKCLHAEVPESGEFPVGEWDSQMSPGSHHFILYRTPGDTAKPGTLADLGCTQGFGGESWLYTAGSPRGHLTFPAGVAMTLQPKERITFDLHYINTTTESIKAQVRLNVNKVKAEKWVKAGAQISFNFGINVPAHGTQTVNGTCTPVKDAKYFLMQTHSHRFTTKASVNRRLANGQMGEVLSMSTDWEKPEVRVWMQEPFLTFQPGEAIAYSCSYKNDTNLAVTVGTSAEFNEMCMAEAYFFPFNGAQPQCL